MIHLQIFFQKPSVPGIRSECVKQFGSRSSPTFCRADLDPDDLERLLADDTSGQRVDFSLYMQGLNIYLWIFSPSAFKVANSIVLATLSAARLIDKTG